MSDVAVIRAAIKARLETVPDIGVVNDYQRWLEQHSQLRALYIATIAGAEQLRGWFISRVSYTEVLVDSDRWSIGTTWRIRGFMALNDANASEKAMDDLVEAAADAFRAAPDLGGVVFSTLDPESQQIGLQLVKQEPVLFASVLCHSADCRLFTQHLK